MSKKQTMPRWSQSEISELTKCIEGSSKPIADCINIAAKKLNKTPSACAQQWAKQQKIANNNKAVKHIGDNTYYYKLVLKCINKLDTKQKYKLAEKLLDM